MTPRVKDALIAARKEVHHAIAENACVSDTAALHVLDQLITADAGRAVRLDDAAEVVAGLSADAKDPWEDAEVRELRAKLEKLEKQREQDSKLIDGLHAELKKRGAQ